MLTAFCGPLFLHCDNHSLASFKDRANPPTAPSAACFVPSAESSHLVPASCCQLLPGPASITGIQWAASHAAAARAPLRHGGTEPELPNAHKRH